ncbi:hypothetical protein FQR65_LT08702 [Abscondita terminalis]|nr:hypothetical protein FQR65_LT08702 [Abscondita terminalis]
MKKLFAVLVLLKAAIGLKHFVKQQMELNSCVVHTINNIFNENNSILFVSEVGEEFGFLDEFTNPYAIANTYGVQRPEAITNLFLNNHNVVAHFVHMKELSKFIYFWNSIIQTIRFMLNATENLSRGSHLTVVLGYFGDFKSGTFTFPFYYDDVVWSVPIPNRIPPPVVLKLVFKPTLWLLVIVSLILTSFAWWLVAKIFKENIWNNLDDTILDVYSITMLGSSSDVPIKWAMRYAFLSYVIYAIHIQTAFTSNLTQILTIPKYEPHIKNLKDLADSNLPIFVKYRIQLWLNSTETKSVLHKTINDKVFGLTQVEFHKLILDKSLNNYCSIWNRDEFDYFRKSGYKRYRYFVDNTFSGSSKYAFFLHNATINLWPAFKASLEVLTESGIVSYRNNILKYFDKQYSTIMDDGYVDMTIEHMCSIFAIWGLGLCLAFVIFLSELLISKIYGQ